MELIHYVAEKLVLQHQQELHASMRKQAMIQEAEVKKERDKKSFAITLWNIEITVRTVKQAN
jgi:hypothetical protein